VRDKATSFKKERILNANLIKMRASAISMRLDQIHIYDGHQFHERKINISSKI